MQPNQWRRQSDPPSYGFMPCLTLAHLEHIAKGAYLKPIAVGRAALQLAGVMTLAQEATAIPSELWQVFADELRQRGGLTANDVYGLMFYPANTAQSGFFCLLGIPVTDTCALDEAWVVKTLPARQYVRFIHKGLQRDLPLTFDYAYHTWLPQSTRRLSAQHVIVHYGPGFDDSDTATCEIYLPVE